MLLDSDAGDQRTFVAKVYQSLVFATLILFVEFVHESSVTLVASLKDVVHFNEHHSVIQVIRSRSGLGA